MRFYQTLLSGAALVAAALAVEINEYPSEVQPGRSYTITYTPGDNTPTTFILRQGNPNDLNTIGEIGTATGGTFTWEVEDSLPNGDDYALEIVQGDENNYSGLITLSGSTDPSSTPSSTPSASSGSAMSSAYPTMSSSASASESSSMSMTMTMTTGATTASASAGVSSSVGMNSTVSTATIPSTGSATGTSTETSGPPLSTGAASAISSSPLALIFGAVAAMAYLN